MVHKAIEQNKNNCPKDCGGIFRIFSNHRLAGTAGAYKSRNQGTDKNCIKVVLRKLKARSYDGRCFIPVEGRSSILRAQSTHFTGVLEIL
jgi:hypothetical protein